MNNKKYFKTFFLSAGVYVGPVVIALSLIGLSFSLIDYSMSAAFFYGFTAFLGAVYMLRSAQVHRNDIVVDVNPDNDEENDGEVSK